MSTGCVICGKDVHDGVALYRVNEKGQPGIWACEDHVKQTGAVIDPEVQEIVEMLKR